MAVLAAAGLAMLLAPIAVPSVLPRAHATSTTITGNVSKQKAWDVANSKPFTKTPTVTVDQTDNLTDQVVHVTWTNFSPSLDSSTGGPISSINNPGSNGSLLYLVTVLECRGVNPQVSIVFADTECYPYSADNSNASHGVGNQTFGITGPDGTGEAYMHVETKQTNDRLGCDPTHPCSLVVVPNWGGKQYGGDSHSTNGVDCADHSTDGSFGPGNFPGTNDAGDNKLGGACSWPDRFVVPLQFAKAPTDCPATSDAFAAAGSPMLQRAMDQWRTGWCTQAQPLTLDYDSGTNEYLARQSFLSGSGALTSSTDAAMVTRPAESLSGDARRFTYAPLATTGISIAVLIDSHKTAKVLTDVRLNARLVAKLLTQSYSMSFGCAGANDTSPKQGPSCDPAVKGNPKSIFADPEFQQLNPQLAPFSGIAGTSDVDIGTNGAWFLPLVVSGNSDLTYELTRWVVSDPEAAAFLAGQPAPGGMHVNTYYRGQSYPLDQFTVQDPGFPDPTRGIGGGTMQNAWSPIAGLGNVVNSAIIARPSSVFSTSGTGTPQDPHRAVRDPAQSVGSRAIFAVMDQGDAAAAELPVAKLVNSAGVAVAPTTVSLAAGVKDMTTNPDKITQSPNFDSTDPKAYPLTEVDYAMVPTCGLSPAKANGIGTFLDKVTASQNYGLEPGLLAPGYLALTNAQKAQTQAAAQAVRNQGCLPNPPTGPSPPPNGPSGPGGNDHNQPGGPGDGSGPSGSNGPGGNNGTHGPDNVGGRTPGNGPHDITGNHPDTKAASSGIKHGDSGGPMRYVLPVLLITGAVLILGGPGLYAAWASGVGPSALRRLRALLRIGN
ncbi:MAG TPA: hypothetical protein VGL21_10270 [Jatrophihabitantaceae bacterium]